MTHDQDVEMKLAEMLADRPRKISQLAVDLRRHIAKLAPRSSELLYQTYAVSNVFTYTGKLGQAFIHIATYASHVNLGFNQGAKLEDPEGLLKGTGKQIRHIRISDMDLAQAEGIKNLIIAAIEIGRQMAMDGIGIKEQSFSVKSK